MTKFLNKTKLKLAAVAAGSVALATSSMAELSTAEAKVFTDMTAKIGDYEPVAFGLLATVIIFFGSMGLLKRVTGKAGIR